MKAVGYILSLAGLGLVVLSGQASKISFISSLGPKAVIYTLIAGVALVCIGVAFILGEKGSSKRINQASEEVPIYAGEGKNRRIVGYQRANIK